MDVRPELLSSAHDPKALFGADGLLASLTARLVERVTEAELDHHLRAEDAAARKNRRNTRRLLSSRGPLEVVMPRDRTTTCEPKLIPLRRVAAKYLRRLPDFDAATRCREKVLLSTAGGSQRARSRATSASSTRQR